MKIQTVAVIDIGKTNKKICVFDETLALVDQRHCSIDCERDGELTVEPVEAIWSWLRETLASAYHEHHFGAIAVSTHGATFALLDERLKQVLPVLAYDHPLTDVEQEELDRDFYRTCGPLSRLQPETATCDLPLLVNPAKAIRFLQLRRPEAMACARHLVHYPQYWGLRLTGRLAAEPTYSCNHSFLLDPATMTPSSAAVALGVADLVPVDFRHPWDCQGLVSDAVRSQTGLPALPVVVGIHDSNAALLPYLVTMGDQDFALNSTGTWCVAMHRVDEIRYAPEEIGRKIIFNRDAFGDLHKTAFLMGGQERSLYHGLIGGEQGPFDAGRIDAALTDGTRAILPGAFPSQFAGAHGGAADAGVVHSVEDLRAGRRPPWFDDPVLAHDLLNVSLALQSEVALRRCALGPETAIFIEGGFRRNPTYGPVLAALFPDAEVCFTDLEQASATGAAMLGHAFLAGTDPRLYAGRLQIERAVIPKPDLPHLAAYRAAFLGLAGEG